MKSKKRLKLNDRILRVEVVGTASLLWRQIRVPGTLSMAEFGEIVRTSFSWPTKFRSVFLYPEDHEYTFEHSNMQEETVADIFQSAGDRFYIDLYQGRRLRWSHLIRCLSFAEGSVQPLIEKGGGLAPASKLEASKPSSDGDRLEGVLPAAGSSRREFDLVAANQRLLNRRGAQVPYAQNRCRAIILIDSRSIRRDWEKKLSAMKRQLEKLETLIRQHDEVDQPAFRIWIRKKFGPALSRMQEICDRVATLTQRFRLLSLLDAKYRGRKSKLELFRLALDIEAGKVPWPEEADEMSAEEDNLAKAGRNISPEEREFFESQMRELENEFGELPPEVHRLREMLSAADSSDSRDRCKSVYRKIVLYLHPDRSGPLEGSKLALWHRAQNAYQSGDLVTLESILHGCSEEVLETSIQELKQAFEAAQQQLEQLKMRISWMKKEPTWNFTKQKGKQLERREREAGREIDNQREELESELEFLERENAHFGEVFRQPQPRGKRGVKSSRQTSFPF